MRGIVAVILVVVATTLVGCNDEPEPRFDDPTESPSESASASDPTSSAAAEPEPWEEKSKAGAVAFAKRWVDVFNRAIVEGETSELVGISDPKCRSCNDIVERIRQTYQRNGYFETDGWRVLQSTVLMQGGSAELGLRIFRSEQRYRDSAAEPEQTDQPSKATYQADLVWIDAQWKMKKLAIFQ